MSKLSFILINIIYLSVIFALWSHYSNQHVSGREASGFIVQEYDGFAYFDNKPASCLVRIRKVAANAVSVTVTSAESGSLREAANVESNGGELKFGKVVQFKSGKIDGQVKSGS